MVVDKNRIGAAVLALAIATTTVTFHALPTEAEAVGAGVASPSVSARPWWHFWSTDEEDAEAREARWRQQLVDTARTQLGVEYCSLHYGPDGDPYGNGEGFGCAMFVSYAYNNVFFGGARADEPAGEPLYTDGFAGWTQAYWSNAADDCAWGLNPGFVEVSYENAKPGDVICYMYDGDAYEDSSMCYHVAMYVGDGWMIESNFGGVTEQPLTDYGSEIHFLSYAHSTVARSWRG